MDIMSPGRENTRGFSEQAWTNKEWKRAFLWPSTFEGEGRQLLHTHSPSGRLRGSRGGSLGKTLKNSLKNTKLTSKWSEKRLDIFRSKGGHHRLHRHRSRRGCPHPIGGTLCRRWLGAWSSHASAWRWGWDGAGPWWLGFSVAEWKQETEVNF